LRLDIRHLIIGQVDLANGFSVFAIK